MPVIRDWIAGMAGAILMVQALIMLHCGELAAMDRASSGDFGVELSDSITIATTGARNPTVAVDSGAGSIYLAWAQESRPPQEQTGYNPTDPRLEALLTRSDDGGRNFSEPVVVNGPREDIRSHTVSPTKVAVGKSGEVYVLYNRKDADIALPDGNFRSRNQLRLARSEDHGQSFKDRISLASEDVEGVVGSPGMINLFVAANGDLYASWLDYREMFSYLIKNRKEPPKGFPVDTQLRVARSSDSGRSFRPSTLVTKPVCGCCGTHVAQGKSGPLYASTRAAWPELQGSVDAVRDIVVAASPDQGRSWAKAVKIHDDQFKISACPDVAPGLAVDSKGRLHAAWYTGSERNPGVFYAVSTDQGKSFSEPLELLSDEWVPYADVKLALDAKDNAWVAFEDRRGDIDLIHLARVSPEGHVSRAEPWPGTIPDIATRADSAVVTFGTLPAGEDEHGGSVQLRIARPGSGS